MHEGDHRVSDRAEIHYQQVEDEDLLYPGRDRLSRLHVPDHRYGKDPHADPIGKRQKAKKKAEEARQEIEIGNDSERKSRRELCGMA